MGYEERCLPYGITKTELLEILSGPDIPDDAELDYKLGYYDEIELYLSWTTK